MKKIAILCAAGVLFSASSAFAFTNEYAGYTINNKTPDFVMQSSKVYGYMHMQEESLHFIGSFTAQNINEAINEKFSTAYFDKVCRDLSVLKKNDAYKAASKMPLLNLEKYTKLDEKGNNLFANGFKDMEALWKNLKVSKVAGRNAINMSAFLNKDDEIFCTYVTLISANDMLYILVSCGPLPEVPKADGSDAPKKAAKSNKAAETGKEQGLIDVKNLDPKAVAKANAGHNKFVKLFKPTAGPNHKVAPVAFADTVSQRTVELPSDWSYGQYNIPDKQRPAVLTVAMPSNTLSQIGEKLLPEIQNNKEMQKLNESAVIAKLGETALKEVKDIVFVGSMNLGHDKNVADALANPGATKLQLDIMFHTGLKELQKLGGPYIKLNSYKFANDIGKNHGVVTVNADVTALRKVEFLTRVKLVGTPEMAMAAWQIHNKTATEDKTAKALYECWQF